MRNSLMKRNKPSRDLLFTIQVIAVNDSNIKHTRKPFSSGECETYDDKTRTTTQNLSGARGLDDDVPQSEGLFCGIFGKKMAARSYPSEAYS
jgi:hypothetical protein